MADDYIDGRSGPAASKTLLPGEADIRMDQGALLDPTEAG